jgi:hypothetical protein
MLHQILILSLNNCFLSSDERTLGDKAEVLVKKVKLTFEWGPIGQQSKQMHMATSDLSKSVV